MIDAVYSYQIDKADSIRLARSKPMIIAPANTHGTNSQRTIVTLFSSLNLKFYITPAATAGSAWSDLCDSGKATHKLSHGKTVQGT